MAKDSVFNATSVLRAVTGIDIADFDLHINVVGGGNIDGPSAGLAIFLALYSAVTKTPLPQDVAMTGELSIQGKVRAVGGIVEKLYAARQAGMRRVLIPKENAREVDAGAGRAGRRSGDQRGASTSRLADSAGAVALAHR